MKKSVYFRTMYSRPNPIKAFLSDLFFKLCSYPRLVLEVFIRKNFGERYFSFTVAVFIFLFLLILPLVEMINPWAYWHPSFMDVLLGNISWYVFLGLFFTQCLRRKKEIKHVAAEFNFAKFTKSSGDLLPEFLNFKFKGKPVSIRNIETVVEPLFFFLIGAALIVFSQKIGFVILLCSILYSLGYCIAYWRGDTIILDMIDEIIVNNALFDVFVDGDDRATKNGFRVFGDRPADPNLRQQVANNLTGLEEEPFEAI